MAIIKQTKISSRLLTAFFVSWTMNVIIIPIILVGIYEISGPGVLDGLAGSSTSTEQEREIGNILLTFIFPICMGLSFLVVAYIGYRLARVVYVSSHRTKLIGVLLMVVFAAFISIIIGSWKGITT